MVGDEHRQGLHTVEEKLNSITHAIGAGLSIAGLVFLLALTGMRSGGVLRYITFTIYGSLQILLYLSSALTHAFTDRPRIHRPLRILDQASIYLLIAGTYTPVALVALRGAWGWSVFGTIWGLAVAGILMKSVFRKDGSIVSDLLYLPMGWLIVVAFRPLRATAPAEFVMWSMIGGGLYTGGIVFYMLRRMPFSHVVWHLFVLAGGISFYLAFAMHLT